MTEEIKKYRKEDRHKVESPLEEAVAGLVFDNPWYGIFIQHFERVLVTTLKTASGVETMAGVSVKDNQVKLYINTVLFDPLPLEQRMGILEHECLHIVNKHIMRCSDRNFATWNIASDTAINQFIPKNALPEGGCHWDAPPLNTIPGMAPNLVSEKYYELIKKDAQNQGGAYGAMYGSDQAPNQQPTECDKDCSKCPMNSQNSQGQNNCKAKANNPNGKGASGNDKKWNPIDCHDGWANDADGENDKDIVESQIKSAARETSDAITHSGRGTVPGEVQDAIDRLNKPSKIRWQDLLRNFISDSYDIYRAHSYHRESRRIDGVYPGVKRFPKYHPLVAIDVSGSVSDYEIQLMLNECDAICKSMDIDGFDLWQFDASIQAVGKYETYKKSVKIVGRGGTDFQPVFNKCRKEHRPAVIIMTDGGAPAPDMKNIKAYWALTEGAYNTGDHLEGAKVTIEVPKKD